MRRQGLTTELRRDRGARHRRTTSGTGARCTAQDDAGVEEIADSLQFFVNAGAYGKNLRVIARRDCDEGRCSRRCTSRTSATSSRSSASSPQRGHQVHLTADEAGAARRAGAGRTPRRANTRACTWELLPSLDGGAVVRCRAASCGSRSTTCACSTRATPLRPSCGCAPRSASPRIVRWLTSGDRQPLVGHRAAARALKRLERLMPRSEAIEQYLRGAAAGRRGAGVADLLAVAAARHAEGGAGARRSRWRRRS